jgi:hypothetical protein
MANEAESALNQVQALVPAYISVELSISFPLGHKTENEMDEGGCNAITRLPTNHRPSLLSVFLPHHDRSPEFSTLCELTIGYE